MRKPGIPNRVPVQDQSFPLYEALLDRALRRPSHLPIPEKALQDLMKGIELLKFIELNLDWIRYAVSHRSDPTLYRFRHDQAKGVLRDNQETSFHINAYKDADSCIKTLKDFTEQFKSTVSGVLGAQAKITVPSLLDPLSRFVMAFEYTDSVGCMEARFAKPMTVGCQIVSETPVSLDELMEAFCRDVPEEQQTMSRAQDYFKSRYGQIILASDSSQQVLTPALIQNYCSNFLGILEEKGETSAPADVGESMGSSPLTEQPRISKRASTLDTPVPVDASREEKSGSGGTAPGNSEQEMAERYLQVISSLMVAPQNKRLISDGQSLLNDLITFIQNPNNKAPLFHLVTELSHLQRKAYPKILENFFTTYQSTDQYKLLYLLSYFFLSRMKDKEILTALEVHKNPSALQNKDGWTLWYMAARYQSPVAFIKLLDKVAVGELSAAHTPQNNDGQTLWHMAARYQSAEAFIKLLDKVAVGELSAVHALQNKGGWTLWHMAARYQSAEAFTKLLDKVAIGELSAVHALQNKNGWTLWHMAARYQSPEVFIKLLDKVAIGELSAVHALQNKDGWTLWHIAACTQNAEAIIALINKCTGNELVSASSSGVFEKLAARDSLTQCQVLEALLSRPDLNAQTHSQIDTLLQQEKWKAFLHHRPDLSTTYPQVFSALRLPPDCPSPELSSVNGMVNREALRHYFQVSEGELLSMKIVRSHGLSGGNEQEKTVKRLANYAYDRDLRRPYSSEDTRKWHMQTDEIEIYYHNNNKTGKTYTSTSKTAVSPLNALLTTLLFGAANRPDETFVFLLLSVPSAACRALSIEDFGSYHKCWVGSSRTVDVFRAERRPLHYPLNQWRLFQERLDQREGRTPEVLATLTREMILAVGFAADSPKAYRETQAFRNNLQSIAPRELPLLYFAWSCGVIYRVDEPSTNDALARSSNSSSEPSNAHFLSYAPLTTGGDEVKPSR